MFWFVIALFIVAALLLCWVELVGVTLYKKYLAMFKEKSRHPKGFYSQAVVYVISLLGLYAYYIVPDRRALMLLGSIANLLFIGIAVLYALGKVDVDGAVRYTWSAKKCLLDWVFLNFLMVGGICIGLSVSSIVRAVLM